MLYKPFRLLLFLLFLKGISFAQPDYFGAEYSIFQLKQLSGGKTLDGLFEKTTRSDGSYTGASYAISIGRNTAINVGIGSSRLYFQKETQGVFTPGGSFGLAIADEQLRYWSFPVSFSIGRNVRYSRRYGRNYSRYHLKVTYIPSFESDHRFSLSTFGGADLNEFSASFRMDEQSFQHSLLLGFSNLFYLPSGAARLCVNPFIGIGSGYFKDSGSDISTLCFGINLSLDLRLQLPVITIEKETSAGALEKKKLLEKKQQEIKEQLKHQPK